MSHYLSKSRLLSGRQCIKRLYLGIHRPQLAAQSAAAGRAIAIGNDVHDAARLIYPGGTFIEYDERLGVPFQETRDAIERPV
jgi:hypothetical protein